jgi:hypothetical protein
VTLRVGSAVGSRFGLSAVKGQPATRAVRQFRLTKRSTRSSSAATKCVSIEIASGGVWTNSHRRHSWLLGLRSVRRHARETHGRTEGAGRLGQAFASSGNFRVVYKQFPIRSLCVEPYIARRPMPTHVVTVSGASVAPAIRNSTVLSCAERVLYPRRRDVTNIERPVLGIADAISR